jgi:RsiW-degrading membrane proteinase PrsW (M82 family)
VQVQGWDGVPVMHAPGAQAPVTEPKGHELAISKWWGRRGGLERVAIFVAAVIAFAMVARSASGALGLVGLLVIFGLYVLPTIIAVDRHHHQTSSIAIINFFLGFTVIGWVVALAMAFSATTPEHPARPA